MAEPARKLNPDEDNQNSSSAQERANNVWFDRNAETPDATNQAAAGGALSARDRADEAWGMDRGLGDLGGRPSASQSEDITNDTGGGPGTNGANNVTYLPNRQADYDDSDNQASAAAFSGNSTELGRSKKDLGSLLDREKGSGMSSSKGDKGEKNRLKQLLGGKKDGEESADGVKDDDPYGMNWTTNIGDGRKGAAKWAVKNRKNLAIGGGVLGAFLALIVIMIGFFIPYKLTAIIEDINSKVGEVPEYAIEQRLQYHLSRYLIIKQLAKSGVTGAADKNFVYLDRSIAKSMYVNWSGAEIEGEMFKNGYTLKPNGPDSKYTNFSRNWSKYTRPTAWDIEFPDGTPPKKLTSKEARLFVNEYASKTRYNSVFERYHKRYLMKKYFGLRNFKWLDKLDSSREKYYAKKRELKSKLAENTVGRINERAGKYLSCMAEGGAVKACKKSLDEPDGKTSGKVGELDSSEIDDIADDAVEAVEEAGEDIADAVTPGERAAANAVVSETVKKTFVRKLLTAVGGGIAIAELADHIQASLESGVLNLIVYDKNAQQYIADVQPVLSMADQIRSGQNIDSDSVRLATELFDQYESSPLLKVGDENYDPSKSIKRDCNNDGDTADKDDLLEPGELVCREKRLAQDKTTFTDSQGWEIFSSLVDLYRATLVDDAIDFGTEWITYGLDKTGLSSVINGVVDVTGLDSLMQNGFGFILNRIAGPVITGNEEGADKYESAYAGITALSSASGGGSGESRADTIGGGYLSIKDVAAIRGEQQEQRQYALKQKGVFARYFSPDVKESLTMKFAMTLPSSVGSLGLTAQDGVASIASLKGLRSLGSIFTGKALAATPGVSNPFHAVYYGYPPDHPVFVGGEDGGPMSTEEIWEKYNCDEQDAAKREANKTFGKPDGVPFDVNTESDPCLLEKVAIEAGTKYFDNTFDEGIDDGTGTGTTNQADTTNPNIYVLGDSLTAGMEAADLKGKLTAKGWKQITIAGLCGRKLKVDLDKSCDRPAVSPMPGGLQQIDQPADQAAIKAAGTVVVGLGTNDAGDPAFRINVETMIDKIRALNASTNIYWTNLYSTHNDGAPLYPAMNQILTELSTTKNFKIIDWAKGGPPSYNPGNIHPRDYNAMAQFVVDGIGSPPAAPAGGESQAMVGDPFESSLSVPCDPRTKDIGEFTGYTKGNPVQHRMCSVPNMPATGNGHDPKSRFFIGPGAEGFAVVNSRASGALFSMVEAAKADGITLSAGSSFRTKEHQEYLCATDDLCPKGNYAEVARPGTSNHQSGLAIDFALGGDKMIKVTNSTSCATRAKSPNSPMWKWLAKNAERFGYKQYHVEAWHYDASPDGCDGSTAGF